MAGTSQKLEHHSYRATIAASIVAIITLIVGVVQFSQTQIAQRESIAFESELRTLDLFSKYNELMMTGEPTSPSDSTYFWKNNLSITIAESIFRLNASDKSWKATVGWMLQKHAGYLKDHGLGCETYAPDFIKFVQQTVGFDVCR